MSGAEEFDCVACGKCCFHGPDYVPLYDEDLVALGPVRVAALTTLHVLPREQWATGENEQTRFMRSEGGHCAALQVSPGRYFCSVYEDRPLRCAVFAPGSPACLAARAR